MKTNKIMIFTLLTIFTTSCKTEDVGLKILDGIQETKYYSSDIISVQYTNIYGVWEVSRTSGGFVGIGYKKDFDFLILKKNGIFGIIHNDSLISYGKLTLLPDATMHYNNAVYCRFNFEKPANIELYGDSEKYIRLINNDSLDLIAPCCDRYNTHFVRKK